MAKKARNSTSVRESQTAESIRGLIDALPPPERKKVFDQLACHPENTKGNAWWHVNALHEAHHKAIDRACELQRRFFEVEYYSERVINHATAILSDALEVLYNSIPKRGMSKARIETAQAYLSDEF